MTNTENYNLNLPDADDFYNIEDINENMETIDAAMFSLEENIGQTSEKIGTSADTGTDTVMAKLNSVISALESGTSVIKSVQRGVASCNPSTTVTISSVNTRKSVVLYGGISYEGGKSGGNSPMFANVVLTNATTITINVSTSYTSSTTLSVPWQVIEFY